MLIATAGCTRGLELPLPPVAGYRSMLLATSGSAELALRAYRLTPPPSDQIPLPPFQEGATPTLVEALLYTDTLETLGLPTGDVPRAAQDGRMVPTASAAYSALIDTPDHPLAFTPTMDRSDALARALLPVLATPCAEWNLHAQVFGLPTMRDGAFAVALDRDRALIGAYGDRITRTAEVFLLDRRSGNAEVRPVSVTPGVLPSSGVRSADGVLWIGDSYGAVWTGTLAGDRLDLTPVSQSPSFEQVTRMAVGRGVDGDVELFTLGPTALDHFTRGAWAEEYRFNYAMDFEDDVAWVGPGEAIAAHANKGAFVVRVKDGQSTDEPVPTLSTVLSTAHELPFGSIAGTTQGELYHREPAGWVSLGESPFRVFILTIAPYQGGFLLAGAFGNIGQYIPGYGFCPVQQLTAFNIRHLAVLGEDLVVLGANPSVAETPLALLTRR